MPLDETDEQQITRHISAMDDSVTTISNLLNNPLDEDVAKRIRANYQHLEIMLNRLDGSLNIAQKENYNSVILSAKTFLNE